MSRLQPLPGDKFAQKTLLIMTNDPCDRGANVNAVASEITLDGPLGSALALPGAESHGKGTLIVSRCPAPGAVSASHVT